MTEPNINNEIFNGHETIEEALFKLNKYFGFAIEYLNINRQPLTGRYEKRDKLNKFLMREESPVDMKIVLEDLNINVHSVTGREDKINKLNKFLMREDTPVVMEIGLAGSGKTALVESWGRIMAEKGEDLHLITVNIGSLGSGEDLRRRI